MNLKFTATANLRGELRISLNVQVFCSEDFRGPSFRAQQGGDPESITANDKINERAYMI